MKGVFHAGFFIVGGMLLSWDLFNIMEGVLDHHLLKLYNVIELSSNPEIWNFGFLGLSVLLIIVG